MSFTEMFTTSQQHREVSRKNSQDIMIAATFDLWLTQEFASGYSEISHHILNL